MFHRTKSASNDRRSESARRRVTLTLDGRSVVAEVGEPIAVALLAAGESAIARSPKLHRPRGPACLRGDCDGCLARVDGVPNVMTCLVPCRGGEAVEVQNVLGTRKTDLLRITDWFFPKGIDHHHLMAGIPAVGDVMQTFARQMAGIGRLPADVVRPAPASTRHTEVLVVGGGLAGLEVAASLARRGVDVHVLDEATSPGGASRHLAPAARARIDEALDAVGERLHRASVAGVYDGRVLATSAEGATLWSARASVFATGAHDGVLACDGNDLPGVMSARAIVFLAANGVEPTGNVVIAGDGPWADEALRVLGSRAIAKLDADEIALVQGRTSVTGVKTRRGKSMKTSLVGVALPGAPAFELAEQAGCKVRAIDAGFAVIADADGVAGPGLWAVGECTGASPDVGAITLAASRAAESIARALGAQPSRTVSNKPSPPMTKTKPKRPSKTK